MGLSVCSECGEKFGDGECVGTLCPDCCVVKGLKAGLSLEWMIEFTVEFFGYNPFASSGDQKVCSNFGLYERQDSFG